MAKSDKYAAVVFVSSKPLDPFVKRKWPEGFKFLPVPLTEKLEEYYMPANLEASDYPGLIAEGTSVQTIAVPAVLAVYAWPQGSDRYRRLSRLIDYMFERLPKLQTEARISSQVERHEPCGGRAGLAAFPPCPGKACRRAAAKSGPSADGGAALKQAIARLVPGDPSEQNRLLQKFLTRDSGDRKSRRQTGR